MAIFVDNLSFGVTNRELCKIFRQYGLVKGIQISDGFDTRHAFTFAFVEMATVKAEKAAIEGLRKFNLLGRELILSKSLAPVSILILD